MQVVIMFLAPDTLLLRTRSARYTLCFVSPLECAARSSDRVRRQSGFRDE
jgi:hypothetical protein